MSRLIDADALHKRIKAKNTSNAMMRAMKAECLAEIDDAPTIESERKTGKWVWQTWSKYMCSECGRMTNVDECMEEPMYIYCPYCGAKMEEGDNS